MSLNKVMLIGRLGQDPEIRYTQQGKAVASLSLATSERWRDKSGNQQEKTEWHKVSIFGRLAEIAGEYLKKGSQVFIDGKITTRKWHTPDGRDRYTTEIVASEMQMLGRGQSGRQSNKGFPNYGSPDAGGAPYNDDIPF